MKTAFLFAGQGSQKAGMGKDIYEMYPTFAAVIDRADQIVDFDLKQLMFQGPQEVLTQTQYTQPALAAFAAGITTVLKENGIVPDCAAGLSLGEYSALHAAGVFTEQDLIRVTAFRGKEMTKAAEGLDTKMCAVLGLDAKTVEDVCRQAAAETGKCVEVSNYNARGQNVISGMAEAVNAAAVLAKNAGARRCMELAVSSTFHTSLMQPVAEALGDKFEQISFGTMEFPVIFNTLGSTADKADPAQIKGLLQQQVMSSVRMAQSIEWMKNAGVERIIEIGPGNVLSGFVRRTVSGITVCTIDKAEDLAKVIADGWNF